jgi:hypothetical protein
LTAPKGDHLCIHATFSIDTDVVNIESPEQIVVDSTLA